MLYKMFKFQFLSILTIETRRQKRIVKVQWKTFPVKNPWQTVPTLQEKGYVCRSQFKEDIVHFKMRWGVSPLHNPLSLTHPIPRQYRGEDPRLSGYPGSIPRRNKCMECFFFLILTLKFDMKGAFDRSYSLIRLYLKFLLQISSSVIF